MDLSKYNDPTFKNNEYLLMEEWARLPRDLMLGNDHMKSKREIYLPRHKDEPNDLYELRLNRSVLYNLYQKFINKVSQIPFRQGIDYSTDFNPTVKSWCSNIDLLGTPLEVWGLNFYKDAEVNGISHFLVENPVVSPNRTLYDDILQGDDIRPYFVHIKSNQLYGWKYEINNSKLELTQIRFWRQVDRPLGLYGSERVTEYVVYSKDLIQVFEIQKDNLGKNQVVLINEVPNSLGIIPLVTLNVNQIDFMLAKPPYGELAVLNLRHYQSYSDQINITHHIRVPIMFGKDLASIDPTEQKDLSLHPGIMLVGGPGSDLKYVEHGGAAIQAGREDIIDLERRYALMSGEFYNQEGVAVYTATSHILNKIESGITPGANIRMLEEAINQGFELMKLYDTSLGNIGTIGLNTEETVIPETVNFQYVTNMYTQGVISKDDYLREAKRRSILDEQTQLFDGPPPLAAPNLNGALNTSTGEVN